MKDKLQRILKHILIKASWLFTLRRLGTNTSVTHKFLHKHLRKFVKVRRIRIVGDFVMVQTKTKYQLKDLHEARHIVKEYFGLKLVYVDNKKHLNGPWNLSQTLERGNDETAMSNQLKAMTGMIAKISIVVKTL
jgi:hypothetical protein